MTQHLDQALRSLNAALAARRLYAPEHASVGAAIDSAVRALELAHAEANRLDIVETDGRLVCGDRVLACGADLCSEGSLFEALRERGFHCLTLVKGVSALELGELLRVAESTQVEWNGELAPRVRLGVVSTEGVNAGGTDRPGDGATGAETPRVVPGPQHFPALESLFAGLETQRCIDAGALGTLAGELCATAALTSSTMVPLASLKTHDEYTFVHTINVAILAAALAEAVGLAPNQVHDITSAALLHDVGKRRVPLELINKRGKLTDEERALMQRHPVDGAIIILQTPGLPPVASIVAYEHHAHMDGTGYPRMPHGWRQHLAARIVQIADVYDALGTHRPYRAALSFDECFAIMSKDAGKMYERDLIDVFFSSVAKRLNKESPSLALAA